LSLLREGDGINFQKASATLDGCVKIYSSRVDSAVTETGRLINGLATSKRSQAGDDEEDHGDESEEEGDELDPNAPVKERRSKASVSQRATIVEFKAIKLKKMDLELYVDPLFKKALTDFDEGGSKSLLLNMLNVDTEGKIMFDTTDSSSSQAIKEEPENQQELKGKDEETPDESDNDDEPGDLSMNDVEHSFAEMDIDEPPQHESENTGKLNSAILELGQRYLGDFHIDNVTVCPSMNELDAVLNQKATSSDLLKGLEEAEILDDYESGSGPYQDDYVDFDFGGGPDAGDFGSFHDSTAKYPGNKTSIFFDDMEDEADDYGITMRELFNEDRTVGYGDGYDDNEDEEGRGSLTNIPDENLLAYFDENQKKNWAGPEHWKVQRIKKFYKPNSKDLIPTTSSEIIGEDGVETNGDALHKKRKPKEHLVIDFISDDNFPNEEEIFQSAGASIMLPKKEWISKDRNVLPEDKHFSTKNFINLFLKEKLINSTFNKIKNVDVPINESLYAEHMTLNNLEQPNDYNNADFFNDQQDNGADFDFDFGDDDDDIDHLTPQSQEGPNSQLLAKSQGKQSPLIYSRVAKKVDVKLLKDNLLESLKKETSTRKSFIEPTSSDQSIEPTPMPSSHHNIDPTQKNHDETLKFTDVVAGLNERYDKETKKDLSTSFCFICLLHLANENGFTITNTDDNSDLIINNIPQLA